MPKPLKAETQPSLFEAEPSQPVERPFCLPGIFLGTSSFTATGWEGSFYPIGMRSRDFLRHYASQFQTVEIDSTFYGTPAASTVTSWNQKTPGDFVFAVKVPQVISHEKVLVDCEPEFDEFIERMHLLGDKLGPMLLQFPKFDKWVLKGPDEFRARLQAFFKRAADVNAGRFAVEVRNKDWLDARFADVLREHNVALALTDTSFMPRPWEMKEKFDLITADFAYVRWLGDRKQIEKQTTTWDKTVIDRTSDLKNWVVVLKQMVNDKRNASCLPSPTIITPGMGQGRLNCSWTCGTKNKTVVPVRIPLDFITMLAPSTRVDFGCLTTKAREEGARHDHYRSRLSPELSANCFSRSGNRGMRRTAIESQRWRS